ncbi:MAG: glycosyltransferase family 4 protein [Enterocloster asparagiformis]|nr:glycosyltransferase family 4 protein [Enterocloster asparagiformis]
MKLVFVHDGPLFYDKKGKYYEFAYHELYQRYSYFADNISFLIRTKAILGTNKFTPVPEQIKVVSVPNFKSLKTFLKNKPIAEAIIENTIRENDYVVLRSQSSIAQSAIKYIKKYNKPYIVECVGCSWDSYWNHGVLGKIVAPYMYIKTRSIIRHADYVYYVTASFLQKRYPTKGKTVCCSNVVLDSLDDKVLIKRMKRLSKFDPTKRMVLGTAAAIDTRYKGQEYVIKAIPKLIKAGYNVEYHLAGGVTGAKKNTFLKDLAVQLGISDRVFFWGSLSADQMNDYYDSLDLYIQPSKQEGLPRAVIEAMSRGCPVVATNIAGIPELVQKECLFKKGCSEEVVEVIKKILKLDLQDIAEINFSKAMQYEKCRLIKKREAFYDDFLNDIKRGSNNC